jgi:hypothetical protein
MTRVPVSALGKYGLVKDMYEQDIPPNAWSSVKNVRFDERGASSFPGHKKLYNEMLTSPVWIKQMPPTSLPRWVYASLTQAYVVENEVHSLLTRVSGPYAGSVSERWQGNLFHGLGIFNNTVDVPQLWSPISSGTKWVDLPNWPSSYRCKFIRPYKDFLVAGNIYDGVAQRPFRLKWSHIALPGAVPTSWDNTDPALDAGQRDLGETSDELVDSLTLGEINIIYREQTTWGMRYIGFPDIFATWPITPDHGIMARDCAVDTPIGHVVATKDDIIVHQGQRGSFQSLLTGQVRRWLFRQINPDAWFACHMIRNTLTKEIWFCFPEAGHSYANLAYVCSWQGHGLGVRALPDTPFVASGAIGPTLVDDAG